ncbi:transporter [Variovorax robiniae]|uniref:Transporter n=1 Tax=Variovorax robiniae TaxID=1836199 RepID=A0ABU8X613_9BURK
MTTFHPHKLRALAVVCSSLACTGAFAQSESSAASPSKSGAKTPPKSTKPATPTQSVLQRQVNAQGQQIEALKKQVADQDARYRELQERLDKEAARTATAPAAPTRPSAAAAFGGAAVASGARPAEGQPPADGERAVRVGVAPAATPEPQAPVAQLFDEPSVLTPRGRFVLEPTLQYGYSSSNRVALVGYTVIPAILIGLIDVREQKSNTFVAGLTGRWGVTNRMELELKVPYVIRSDATVSRELGVGSAGDNVFNTKGHAVGDVEAAMRYQLSSGKDGWPYMVGGLRFKSRTGTDPFSVVTDCQVRCVGTNATGTGLPTELPTGSGFYSLQPSLTWLFPTDPAVFFGGINYTYSFARKDVSRRVLGGGVEQLGDIKPGAAWGLNVGMGLALNDRSSFSLGVELYTIGRTQQNGQSVAGSVRTQLASLLLGYSYRMTDRQTLNVSVGAGLTRDTPDLTLTVRVPFSF